MRTPSRAEIAALAYQLYLEDGKPPGEADAHWQRAEKILKHPENYSDDNILSPPSEPELTRTLDAKAEILDSDLPSDPHSGKKAYHQKIEVAVDAKDKKVATRVREALHHLHGIEQVRIGDKGETVRICFDARRTNPAAIHEALSAHDWA